MSEIKTPPRKLADLRPKWVVTGADEIWGISFDCPCLSADCVNGGRQTVPTKTSWDPRPVCEDSQRCGWRLEGNSWETASLYPSVHKVGHWHGHLINGVLE